MTVKHTKGPWRASSPDQFGDINILHDDDSLAIAAVVSNLRPEHEVAANAQLIAAAAEMLEALECILIAYSHEMSVHGVDLEFVELDGNIKQCRAVIAKAKGESI